MAELLNCCCRSRLPLGGGIQAIAGSKQFDNAPPTLQTAIVRRPILGLVLSRGPTAYTRSYHYGFIQ